MTTTTQLINSLQKNLEEHGEVEMVLFDEKTSQPYISLELYSILLNGFKETSKESIKDFTPFLNKKKEDQ
jgi:hypothetical protein